jgi:hypothetical protein
MPNNINGTMYYSLNYGNVHLITLCSEGEEDQALIDNAQLKWLEQDLIEANANRDKQPWIIAQLHRPLYCSNPKNQDCALFASTLRLWLENLFAKYHVDLVLTSHRHNYERTFPMYQNVPTATNYVNPLAPVYIVNGAGGNREGQMGWGAADQPRWCASRLLAVGYGMLTVVDDKRLQWNFIASANNSVIDSFEITRTT